ncbi:MAG: ABC transporter permease [Acidobacteriota bacterium]|nr:ABC transporter permease [Acidobacteriota bacterium]
MSVAASAARAARTRSVYAPFVAGRFLRTRRQGFVSLIGLLSALGFMVGVASLIVALALITGFQEAMISRILAANAQLLVFPAPGRGAIENAGQVITELKAVPGVVDAAPVVSTKGLIMAAGRRLRWVTINGIDPGPGLRVTDMEQTMVEGSFHDLGSEAEDLRPPLILGEELALELGVLRGDPVTLLVPRPKLTPWGVSLRQSVFRVAGFFRTDYFEYDSGWAFISLHQAQRILGMGEDVSWIAARVEDLGRLEEIEARAQERLGEGFRVDDILRHNRALFSAMKLEKLLMFFAVGLIVLVAALGVISTLVLTVIQKVREIGVLAAMGATPGGVLRIFILQGLSTGLVGTLAGAVLGVGACWVIDRFKLIPLDPDVYYLSYVALSVRPQDVAIVVFVSVLVALLSTLYPAWRAASLDPVEALRGE